MTTSKSSYAGALIVLTSLFFLWGLITSLNDILVPHFKAIFTLTYVQAMLVQLCFFGAYFVASLPCGVLVERIGYRNGIVVGLVVAALACLAFYPAAILRSYPLFLGALFVLACGITVLQVAANPCVAGLGDPATSASRLNLTQAFNSLGTTLGPLIGAGLILSDGVGAAPSHEIATVKGPYLALAGLLALTALIFSRFTLPTPAEQVPDTATGSVATPVGSLWRQRQLVLGTVAIFLYVGAEVAIGSFLVNFIAQPSVAGLSEQAAGRYLALYWGGAMVGRFIGAALLRRVKAGHAIALNGALAIALLVLAINSHGPLAMWAALAVGLCNSIMFPTIFTLAISGLGSRTGEGSGVLCMAIVGGAIVPVVMGYFADNLGLSASFGVPVLCYAFIVHYGLTGHTPRTQTLAVANVEGLPSA